jgi:lysyl-tRNA synthetase, class I
MVRHAFRVLRGQVPTRLIAFSDDMDGLRKVPDNVPNKEMLAEHLGKPLTQVPDPFGTHESFGASQQCAAARFLDAFGFEYEFMSRRPTATCPGVSTRRCCKVLEHYDEVRDVMLPTLGAGAPRDLQPVPADLARDRRVLQVPVIDATPRRAPSSTRTRTARRRGAGHRRALQAAMEGRLGDALGALGVDYEMSGKDLIDSVKLSSQICRILGGTPPEGFNYELFLDEKARRSPSPRATASRSRNG